MANKIEDKLRKQILESQDVTEALKKMLAELEKRKNKKRCKI